MSRYTAHPLLYDTDTEEVSVDLSVTLTASDSPSELSGLMSALHYDGALAVVDHTRQMVDLDGRGQYPLADIRKVLA